MHELSVARSLVEFVCEQVEGSGSSGPQRASVVRVRLGAMCGLLPQSLKHAYRAAVVGTPMEGCELEIETLDLVVWCPHCHQEQLLRDIRSLRCPVCQTRTPQIIQGNEMEIASIEVVNAAQDPTGTPAHS